MKNTVSNQFIEGTKQTLDLSFDEWGLKNIIFVKNTAIKALEESEENSINWIGREKMDIDVCISKEENNRIWELRQLINLANIEEVDYKKRINYKLFEGEMDV